ALGRWLKSTKKVVPVDATPTVTPPKKKIPPKTTPPKSEDKLLLMAKTYTAVPTRKQQLK
ncbi:unnamed protein product, partial [Prorocentrum cordatum]